MKQCILHVGHPKNATTYLQTTIHLNEQKLADAGFWVPSDFTRFGSYDCAALAAKGAVFSGNMQSVFEAYYTNKHEVVNEILHHIFHHGAENIILSSELLFYYTYVIGDIARRAAKAGYELTVVAYLSRQDRATIASYLQNVRNHDFSGDILRFLESVRREKGFKYLDVITGYGLEPPHRCVVRTFEPRFLTGGDIVADFLSTCACPADIATLKRPGKDLNPGLPLEWNEVLRALNALGDPVAKLLRDETPPLDANDRHRITQYYFSSEVRDYIIKEFLVQNEQLVSAYLPNRSAEEKEYWVNVPPSGQGSILDSRKMAACLARSAELKTW